MALDAQCHHLMPQAHQLPDNMYKLARKILVDEEILLSGHVTSIKTVL